MWMYWQQLIFLNNFNFHPLPTSEADPEERHFASAWADAIPMTPGQAKYVLFTQKRYLKQQINTVVITTEIMQKQNN